MGSKDRQEAPIAGPEDLKVSGIEGSPALTRVVATSKAPPPGHWRAKHFWPAGEMAGADLTPHQAELVKADPRIKILTDVVRPDAKIRSTADFVEDRQKAIDAEVRRMVDEGIRHKAVETVRARGTKTAADETRNAPGWKDRR